MKPTILSVQRSVSYTEPTYFRLVAYRDEAEQHVSTRIDPYRYTGGPSSAFTEWRTFSELWGACENGSNYVIERKQDGAFLLVCDREQELHKEYAHPRSQPVHAIPFTDEDSAIMALRLL
jgi:hypothetical protein